MLRFGTDGVRGDADTDLHSALVVALGRAAARVLRSDTFLIGRDTRASGPRIEADLARGMAAEGARVVSLGVVPTPAVAFLAERGATPGAVVSASHNKWTDNGVKLIGADGRKLPDASEAAIESELSGLLDVDAGAGGGPVAEAASAAGATTSGAPTSGALGAYRDHLLDALEGRELAGLHVVLDCANGAGYAIGPQVLRDAGALVYTINAEPDGRNINAHCGSTHPEQLQRTVLERDADMGLALDGDADRALAVDERGELVDGDQIMGMIALDRHERGTLRNDAIAVTVMSNLGLRRALADAGIEVIETPVGDRHVTAAMAARDLALGGEQSGHIVLSDIATTGDGLLTGLLVADLVRRRAAPLSSVAACVTRLPQVLVNVRLARAVDPTTAPEVRDAVRDVEARLGTRGRIVVRSSGTEPVVRVMVEAPTREEADAAAARVQAAVQAAAGAR